MTKKVIGEHLARLLGASVKARLEDGTEVTVAPFTIDEQVEMDELEPYDLGVYEYARLRLFIVLRKVPGFEVPDYDTWKTIFTGEAFQKLLPVLGAIERANPSFRPRDTPTPEPGVDSGKLDVPDAR